MGVDESERVLAANLEKVDHVVVVMLENRSFDHMLGYLSLTGRRPDIDGLCSGFANEYRGRTYPVHHLGTTALDVEPRTVSSTLFDHTSIIKTILLRFCPKALHEPQQAGKSHAQKTQSRLGVGPQYPGMRVARASHLGELLTRATPRPAPPRDALLRHAATRATQARSGQPRTGHGGPGRHPPNDLQKSILAATHELTRRGHPSNLP